MNKLSCPICGTQLNDKITTIPSKWGDFEMNFSNVHVMVCEKDNEYILSMLTARLIQKFTIFFSNNPLPNNTFSLIGLEKYLSNRKEQNKLIKQLEEGKIDFIKHNNSTYRVNPIDLSILVSSSITVHNLRKDLQDIKFAARNKDCQKISDKDLGIISDIFNRGDK